MEVWFLAVSVGFGAASLLVLLLWHGRNRPSTWRGGARANKPLELVCRVCGRTLVFNSRDLTPLSPVERALSVRAKPELAGHALAEYVCPYCEAAHCFATGDRTPQYAGTNLYQPQSGGARCMECGRQLQDAPPDLLAIDYAARGSLGLGPGCGLVCERCHAVCCVECCERTTRRRSLDGNLACPRCFRQPIKRVFHVG
mgnify:FL=1